MVFNQRGELLNIQRFGLLDVAKKSFVGTIDGCFVGELVGDEGLDKFMEGCGGVGLLS